jgi:hypothetical protein
MVAREVSLDSTWKLFAHIIPRASGLDPDTFCASSSSSRSGMGEVGKDAVAIAVGGSEAQGSRFLES